MEIEIQAVSSEARIVVERLLQLYEYDISRMFGSDLEEDGLYHVLEPDRPWQADYRVFLIRANSRLAGFAFVTRHPAYLGEGETWLMNELFIMHKYRRQGTGAQVATTLFDRFPGRWEVAELTINTPAQTFWRRVIGRYTDGAYREVVLNSERWRGPVQSFASKAGASP